MDVLRFVIAVVVAAAFAAKARAAASCFPSSGRRGFLRRPVGAELAGSDLEGLGSGVDWRGRLRGISYCCREGAFIAYFGYIIRN